MKQNKTIIDVNLEGLPRPLAAAFRYLAEQSWKVSEDFPDNYMIPTSDAARMLGVPVSTLTLWCRRGKVKAYKVGSHWRVDVDDAREYLIRKSV